MGLFYLLSFSLIVIYYKLNDIILKRYNNMTLTPKTIIFSSITLIASSVFLFTLAPHRLNRIGEYFSTIVGL